MSQSIYHRKWLETHKKIKSAKVVEVSKNQELELEIGVWGGLCNRSACRSPDAKWYNYSTRKYYCGCCARLLNNDPFNKRDSMDIFGHDLCIYEEEKQEH